jgi:hypothetical protein
VSRCHSKHILYLLPSSRYCHGLYPDRLPANVCSHLDHLFRSINNRSTRYHKSLVQDLVLYAISTLVADSHHHPHSWSGISTSVHPADFGCMVRNHEDLHDIRQLLSSWESQGNLFSGVSGRACSHSALVPRSMTPIGESIEPGRIMPLLLHIDIDIQPCITFNTEEQVHHAHTPPLSAEIVGGN